MPSRPHRGPESPAPSYRGPPSSCPPAGVRSRASVLCSTSARTSPPGSPSETPSLAVASRAVRIGRRRALHPDPPTSSSNGGPPRGSRLPAPTRRSATAVPRDPWSLPRCSFLSWPSCAKPPEAGRCVPVHPAPPFRLPTGVSQGKSVASRDPPPVASRLVPPPRQLTRGVEIRKPAVRPAVPAARPHPAWLQAVSALRLGGWPRESGPVRTLDGHAGARFLSPFAPP